MRMIVYGSIFLFASFSFGCTRNSPLTEQELESYVLDPKNELIQKVKTSEISLSVHYRPKDLILSQQLRGVIDETERNDLTSSLDSVDYFVIRFSRNGQEIESKLAGDPARFNEAINYLSFGMSSQVNLITDEDTIPPLDIIYARTYGGGEGTNVLVAFKSGLNRSDGTVTLLLEDSLLGTGTNEFDFNIDKIKNLPRIK